MKWKVAIEGFLSPFSQIDGENYLNWLPHHSNVWWVGISSTVPLYCKSPSAVVAVPLGAVTVAPFRCCILSFWMSWLIKSRFPSWHDWQMTPDFSQLFRNRMKFEVSKTTLKKKSHLLYLDAVWDKVSVADTEIQIFDWWSCVCPPMWLTQVSQGMQRAGLCHHWGALHSCSPVLQFATVWRCCAPGHACWRSEACSAGGDASQPAKNLKGQWQVGSATAQIITPLTQSSGGG